MANDVALFINMMMSYFKKFKILNFNNNHISILKVCNDEDLIKDLVNYASVKSLQMSQELISFIK